MNAGMGFEVASEALEALLDQVHEGRIQAPEFQRAVVLKDEWVNALLASVSLGYPVGAVMLLEADDYYARFATHPVPGAPPAAHGRRPERLLVDGQHRLAALYQALRSGEGVLVRDGEGGPTRRSYSIDMRAAIDPAVDRDEAIFSVGEGGWSRALQEGDAQFPLGLVFGREDEAPAGADGTVVLSPGVRGAHGAERGQSPATTDRGRWLAEFVGRGPERDETRAALVRRFEAEVLSAFDAYVVPTIRFPKEWTRWTARMRGGENGRALSDALGIPRRGEAP